MPGIVGRGSYGGYKQPPASGHSEAEKHMLRVVYGTCRQRHPGEDPASKSLCARIAWAAVDKKFRR